MTPAALPASPLVGIAAVELKASHVPALQRFFEANPDYFFIVQGEPASPDEGREEIEALLPEGVPHTRKWVIGFVRPDGELIAMANLVSDIFAPTVWNISTFMVDHARQGSGEAQRLYEAIESWAFESGARWLRLGVVTGNVRGERFWVSRGFVQTRTRSGYPVGKQLNELRVMFKPLAGGTMADYLARVPRDRPEPA